MKFATVDYLGSAFTWCLMCKVCKELAKKRLQFVMFAWPGLHIEYATFTRRYTKIVEAKTGSTSGTR